ncbi:MAG: Xaa-Pro peptidase family protein [Pseudomonadota bacterium]
MLHFTPEEFARRQNAVNAAMDAAGLDALLLFAPESQYWLTGFDTFGYCFFQCLVWDRQKATLLTRSADLRQAQMTSNISDIRVWRDAADATPAQDLADLLVELGLNTKRLGVEWDTHGLTAGNGRRLAAALDGQHLIDASALLSPLRLVKSEPEIVYIRKAAELADDALDAALDVAAPGKGEAEVFAAMHGAIFGGGGGAPANPFIVGAGPHALLCRTQEGRGTIADNDQLTLEWAGTYRHYHAACMRTVIIGEPRPQHNAMHAAVREALVACEATLAPDRPMGEVFEAHARTLDAAGFGAHRLNACGYALGTRFAPSWMEREMFYQGAPTVMAPGMVFFMHMILMDSDSGAAMSLGRTSLITETGAEPLNRHDLGMLCV